MKAILAILQLSSFENFELIFSIILLPILSIAIGWIIRKITVGSDYSKLGTTKNVIYNLIVGLIAIGFMSLFW